MCMDMPLHPVVDIAYRALFTNLADEEFTMFDVVKTVRRFLVSEDCPTAVEYGVLLALIIAVAATIVSSVGSQVSTSFSEASSSLAS